MCADPAASPGRSSDPLGREPSRTGRDDVPVPTSSLILRRWLGPLANLVQLPFVAHVEAARRVTASIGCKLDPA